MTKIITVHGTNANKAVDEFAELPRWKRWWARLPFTKIRERIDERYEVAPKRLECNAESNLEEAEEVDIDDIPYEDVDQWWQKNSVFQERLRSYIAPIDGRLEFEPFLWSGANSEKSRRKAGDKLRKKLRMADRQGDPYIVIGHSHGGSVVGHSLFSTYAKKLKLENLRAWMTVGTPFVHLKRSGTWFLDFHIIGQIVLISILTFIALTLSGSSELIGLQNTAENSARFFIGDEENGLITGRTLLLINILALFITGLIPILLLMAYTARSRKRNARKHTRRFWERFGENWISFRHQSDEAITGLKAARSADVKIIPYEAMRNLFIRGLILVQVLALAFVYMIELVNPERIDAVFGPTFLRTEARFLDSGRANSVAFSHDGKRIITATDDGIARIWNVDDADEDMPFQSLRGHGGFLLEAQLAKGKEDQQEDNGADQQTYAASTWINYENPTAPQVRYKTKIWNVNQGREVAIVDEHSRLLDLSNDGSLLLLHLQNVDAGDNEHDFDEILIKRLNNNELENEGRLRLREIKQALEADNNFNAESVDDDLRPYAKRSVLNPGRFTVARFSADGSRIATGTSGGILSLWNAENGLHLGSIDVNARYEQSEEHAYVKEIHERFTYISPSIHSLSFSDDDEMLLVASNTFIAVVGADPSSRIYSGRARDEADAGERRVRATLLISPENRQNQSQPDDNDAPNILMAERDDGLPPVRNINFINGWKVHAPSAFSRTKPKDRAELVAYYKAKAEHRQQVESQKKYRVVFAGWGRHQGEIITVSRRNAERVCDSYIYLGDLNDQSEPISEGKVSCSMRNFNSPSHRVNAWKWSGDNNRQGSGSGPMRPFIDGFINRQTTPYPWRSVFEFEPAGSDSFVSFALSAKGEKIVLGARNGDSLAIPTTNHGMDNAAKISSLPEARLFQTPRSDEPIDASLRDKWRKMATEHIWRRDDATFLWSVDESFALIGKDNIQYRGWSIADIPMVVAYAGFMPYHLLTKALVDEESYYDESDRNLIITATILVQLYGFALFFLLAVIAYIIGKILSAAFIRPLVNWSNRRLSSQVRNIAYGNDAYGERVATVSEDAVILTDSYSTPSWSAMPSVLGDEIERYTEKFAIRTLARVRNLLGVNLQSAELSLAEAVSEQMSWKELIHTAYFDIPNFAKLVAVAMCEKGLAKPSTTLEQDPQYQEICDWFREMSPDRGKHKKKKKKSRGAKRVIEVTYAAFANLLGLRRSVYDESSDDASAGDEAPSPAAP